MSTHRIIVIGDDVEQLRKLLVAFLTARIWEPDWVPTLDMRAAALSALIQLHDRQQPEGSITDAHA